VEFNDDEFQTAPVYFNDKLTCIVGGKSTGKSILLHNLAFAIDRQQVEDKEKLSTAVTKDVVTLTAVWADGQQDDTRKIVYIPQTYLNSLSDEKESATEIDTLIEDIILLNAESKSAHGEMLAAIKAHKADLNKSFLDLLEIHNELSSLYEQKKELGNKVSIETEIANLNGQKEKLSKELSLSEEEIKQYEQATMRVAELSKQISSINSEVEVVQGYQSVVASLDIDLLLSNETAEIVNKAIALSVEAADKAWAAARNEIVKKLLEPLPALNRELEAAKETETTLKPKVQGNQAIAEIAEKIKQENEKLQRFLELDECCTATDAKEKATIATIVSSAELFRNCHQKFADVVNTNAKLSSQELDFSVTVPFRRDDFIDKLSAIFSINSKVFKQVISSDEFTAESYTREKLHEIAVKLLCSSLPIKGTNTMESALRDVFDDWYNTKYNVKMDNDNIDVMSPGKKALVLLKLLIDLAESNCPILIDQPEDDLDNRSIFDDLIPFIQKKKRQRQIIVVTHNANVVLGADAEEIIVANQQGNNAPNKEYRFEYRSGSIESDRPANKADGTPDDGILNGQGIQQHICDILEGGARAFELRKHKYHI
jgi:ABC-type cobalamin/Fe3+-siderophores transport system ATPase subunit